MVRKSWISIMLCAAIVISLIPAAAGAVSSTTTQVILYLDSTEAYINNQPYTLEVPAIADKGRTYLPARFLSETLGFNISTNPVTKALILHTTYSYIEIDQRAKIVTDNGTILPFNEYVYFNKDGRLLVQMAWVAKAMGATFTYTGSEKKVELTYIKLPAGSGNINPSQPVAKFTFEKPFYRIGEPVRTIDLSYDTDGQNLARTWGGLKDAFFQAGSYAFFQPGTYPITLTVKDTSNNVSEVYTKELTVIDEVFLTEQEYPFYYAKEGTSFKTNMSLLSLPQVPNSVRYDTSRKLLVSDSPEIITEKGILYQDVVKGKGRLYANHQNGMNENVTFAIVATNHTEQEVRIRTTNKGEVYPSPLANLIGHIASVDFLLDEMPDEYLSVKPRSSVTYKLFPQFSPKYGVNTFYDIETDGEVMFTFVAMDPGAGVEQFDQSYLPRLPYFKHVRGTFPSSDIYIEGRTGGVPLSAPMRLSIGDNTIEPYIRGFDAMEHREAENKGNYGVNHHIRIDNPGKIAILFRPRGGNFKGPIKINGQLVMAPVSGTLTTSSGVYVLKRTTGEEKVLDIELTPPAGSYFPVDLIFYPLKTLN
ncbi:stalk domain-containing protein [Paenibacillus alkalitolerans]|uniref:stalk domain-containing protein n=1 Tax=Paenibacillus alkalitolerans TaxID=2799335 RepID=UPI0018F487F5|nr:stalk domain-containing protein [Paenibacillus alkalitolerans]